MSLELIWPGLLLTVAWLSKTQLETQSLSLSPVQVAVTAYMLSLLNTLDQRASLSRVRAEVKPQHLEKTLREL